MNSVALVVLDTLRKDAFDRHFDWLPGRRFERAFSTANWTVPAHASLFTGRYASEVGVHGRSPHFDVSGAALAEQLRDAGYETRAFSANTNVTGHFDFDRGFTDFRVPDAHVHLSDDRLFDWRAFNRDTEATGIRKYARGAVACVRGDCATIPSLIAGARTKFSNGGVEYGGAIEALAELDSMDFGDREFLYLNLMEAHEPYRVPQEYATVPEPEKTNAVGDLVFGDVDGEQVRQAYQDCARYLSDVYREILERLRENFDYVITVSDHGEMLGESGAWGHEHGVYPELVQVPLCITGADRTDTVDEAVTLLDVHATILDAAGLPTDDSRGQSLLGTVAGRELLTEYNGLTPWIRNRIVEDGHGDKLEEYDALRRGYAAEREGYWYETRDGIRTDGDVGSANRPEGFDRLVADLDVRSVETVTDVPEAAKERLRDLGYV